MSDISRRDVLRRLALAMLAAGVVDRVSAQEVHQMASQADGRDRRSVLADRACRRTNTRRSSG